MRRLAEGVPPHRHALRETGCSFSRDVSACNDSAISQTTVFRQSLVLDFRTARDWKQFHTPKELAISLVVESAELLEIFQWKQGEELNQAAGRRRTEIADELADCLHSILLLAHDLKIDPGEALFEKMREMEGRYPVATPR